MAAVVRKRTNESDPVTRPLLFDEKAVMGSGEFQGFDGMSNVNLGSTARHGESDSWRPTLEGGRGWV